MTVRLGSSRFYDGVPISAPDLNDTFNLMDLTSCSFTRDTNGRVTSISYTDFNVVVNFTYDTNGFVSQVDYVQDGVTIKTATFTYDTDGNLTEISVS